MSADLAQLLAAIQDMGVEGLRSVWRERLGEPPPIRSRDILRRALAEQLQMAGAGRDAALDRRLAKVAAQHRTGCKPKVRTTTFKPGSTLVREWQGERHQVEVAADGYIWNGQKHASLSKVARLITGVRWNGPRFFGLREGEAA